jgi:hypothetical protein
MIVSLFGPDGGGKSTVAEKMANAGYVVFSGTNVASWPDTAWHEELVRQGLHEPSIDSDKHFLQKIERAHALARRLRGGGPVVIDSDPLHKALMYDYLHALPDEEAARRRVRERFELFKKLARYDAGISRIHVHVRISDKIDDLEHARTLQSWVKNRGELSRFDPRSVEQSQNMLRACRVLEEILLEDNESVVAINTNRTIEVTDIEEALSPVLKHRQSSLELAS